MFLHTTLAINRLVKIERQVHDKGAAILFSQEFMNMATKCEQHKLCYHAYFHSKYVPTHTPAVFSTHSLQICTLSKHHSVFPCSRASVVVPSETGGSLCLRNVTVPSASLWQQLCIVRNTKYEILWDSDGRCSFTTTCFG